MDHLTVPSGREKKQTLSSSSTHVEDESYSSRSESNNEAAINASATITDGNISALTGHTNRLAGEENNSSNGVWNASDGSGDSESNQAAAYPGDVSGLSLIANASAQAMPGETVPRRTSATNFATNADSNNDTAVSSETASQLDNTSVAAKGSLTHQSPRPDPCNPFVQYPLPASNDNHNPQAPVIGNPHYPTMTNNGSPNHHQQQWRYYNPGDTPRYPYPHMHGYSHGHGPPPPHTQAPPHAHDARGYPLHNGASSSPCIMHNRPVGPMPNANVPTHGPGQPSGPGPASYYNPYGPEGVPPSPYYGPGPVVNGVIDGAFHRTSGDIGGNDNAHGNMDASPSTFNQPSPISNNRPGSGDKRSLGAAMGSVEDVNNGIRKKSNSIHGSDTAESESENIVPPIALIAVNHSTTDSHSFAKKNGPDDQDEFGKSSGQGEIPTTPAAIPATLLGNSTEVCHDAPGSVTPTNPDSPPMKSHTQDMNAPVDSMNGNDALMTSSDADMYNHQYYSGLQDMVPGGSSTHAIHYSQGPSHHAHWQHGPGGTPAHPVYPMHPPHTPQMPPPPHAMYYNSNNGQMDANAHGQHSGMSPQEYDRSIHYNLYNVAPCGETSSATMPPGHSHGHPHVHPHMHSNTPYAAAQSLDQQPLKAYVTPDTRRMTSHGVQSSSNPSNSISREEGEYTKLLRSKGERLTDRKKLQNKAWLDRFEELKLYKEEHGDCMVPQKYAPNPR